MTTSSDYTNDAEWLMSPYSNYSDYVFGVISSGFVDDDISNDYDSNYVFSVRPVFYLSSSASISEGDGTLNNPYLLS